METPKLGTSYALPPDALLTCHPCSIRDQRDGDSSRRRITYASTYGASRRVFCFSEVARKKPSESEPKIDQKSTTFSYTIKGCQSDIVHVDVLPRQHTTVDSQISNDVLLVHETGEIRCLSGDLKVERWTSVMNTVEAEQDERGALGTGGVEYAAVVEPDIAREGLLRSKEDVLMSLDAWTSNDRNARLLILMSKSSSGSALPDTGRMLHVMVICPEQQPSYSKLDRAPVRSLCCFKLPGSTGVLAKQARPSLDVQSGTLQLLIDDVLFTWDLRGTTPKLLPRLQPAGMAILSFLRVSPTLVLASIPEDLIVYDLTYGSIQGRVSLMNAISANELSRKRKFSNDALQFPEGGVELLTFFSDSRVVVGFANSSLVAFQLNVTRMDDNSGSPLLGGSLLKALGRGIHVPQSKMIRPSSRAYIPHPLRHYTSAPQLSDEQAWSNQKTQLNDYVLRDNSDAFDTLFASAAGISYNETTFQDWIPKAKVPLQDHLQDMVNGNGGLEREESNKGSPTIVSMRSRRWEQFEESTKAGTSLWRCHQPLQDRSTAESFTRVDQEKVLYAIGKIFAWHPSENLVNGSGSLDETLSARRLALVFRPPKVLNWLLQSGNLTAQNIGLALSTNGSNAPPSSIVSSQLIDLIMESELNELPFSCALRSTILIQAEEVVLAARPLLSRLVKLDNSGLLDVASNHGCPNGIHPASMSEQHIHVHDGQRVAMHDANILKPTSDGPRLQNKQLYQLLLKLHTFSCPTITKALRTCLTKEEITFLINWLRMQLAAHGWTSWYLETDFQLHANDNTSHGVSLISELLNCALDSIGTVGWLYGSTSSGDWAEILTGLKAEISATLECIEEATYLKGIVGEILRYGKGGAIAGDEVWRPKAAKGVFGPNPTAQRGLLPLGLKAASHISLTKVGAGGKIVKRSGRDLARQKSMQVGKYRVERIRV